MTHLSLLACLLVASLPLAASAAEMKAVTPPAVKAASSSTPPVVGAANPADCPAAGGAQTPGGGVGNGQQGTAVIGPKKPKCPEIQVPKAAKSK